VTGRGVSKGSTVKGGERIEPVAWDGFAGVLMRGECRDLG